MRCDDECEGGIANCELNVCRDSVCEGFEQGLWRWWNWGFTSVLSSHKNMFTPHIQLGGAPSGAWHFEKIRCVFVCVGMDGWVYSTKLYISIARSSYTENDGGQFVDLVRNVYDDGMVKILRCVSAWLGENVCGFVCVNEWSIPWEPLIVVYIHAIYIAMIKYICYLLIFMPRHDKFFFYSNLNYVRAYPKRQLCIQIYLTKYNANFDSSGLSIYIHPEKYAIYLQRKVVPWCFLFVCMCLCVNGKFLLSLRGSRESAISGIHAAALNSRPEPRPVPGKWIVNTRFFYSLSMRPMRSVSPMS